MVIKGNLPVARCFLCQAGQLFDPLLSPNSPAEVFHRVAQSCPTHLKQCTDFLSAVMHLREEEEQDVGGATPPLVTPQDLLHLSTTTSSSLDSKLSQLCGDKAAPSLKLPCQFSIASPSHVRVELEVALLQARAFSRAGDAGKCLGMCRQTFGQLKKEAHRRADPGYWLLAARLYATAGACVVVAKETKARVKLTKQDDAMGYFLMAFQLCFPFSSVLLLRETCLWLGSCMAETTPLLAAHFLSFGMQLTLTHQAVYSIGQKLR